MANHKLTITFDLGDDESKARLEAKDIVAFYALHGPSSAALAALVSLTRDGDRSGANLLAKANGAHYKHHKVPFTEITE